MSRLFTWPFVAALLLLGVAAVLAGPVAGWMNIKLNKKELPLQSSFATLDKASLLPYRLVGDPHILDEVIVEALGTRDYISWMLEDTSTRKDDPLRYVNLLLSYYSGGRNLVPHTPDVCYLGGGYQPRQPHEILRIKMSTPSKGETQLPIRVCTFQKTAVFDQNPITVVYTFNCNGEFVASRTGVRLLTNALGNTYAYFSKVEVCFPNATREESVEGAGRFFERILPLLIKSHWPDFEAAEVTGEK